MKNERFRLLHIIPWIRAISLLLTLIVAAIVPGCGANDDAAADFEDSTVEGEQAFTGDTNLALNKPATASSTTHGAYPSRAVDGNTDGNWGANSVVHTDVNINPWMQVDLQASPFIGSVVLWPRTDCCTDRLSNFRLRVSDDGTNWQDFFYPGIASPQATITVNRNARYVRVQLEGTAGRVLNIAEMQVFGPPNIAQGMTATQSSTTNGGVASRAVDGNTDGVWPNNSVTHTNVEFAPWWQVDLGSAQNVGGVEVYNRTDCCADRLSNFNLLVSDNGTTWTTFYYPGSSAKASFTLNRTARYVKVQLTGTNALSLAEVKVYAAATAPNTSTGVLALNDDVTSPIGAVEGDFSVDAQGAATYSFPIKVPPGTRNVEPKLSLAYRSGSGNGVVGTGWSLSGLPNVTRCPRTVAQDNVRGGVNGDTNDRFCLDGQRLIAIAGAYGAHGTEYRTEIETFSRVYSIGTCGTGPCRFEVTDKMGNLAILGETNAVAKLSDGLTPRVYALSKLRDPNGNYLTVSYQVNNNQLYPQQILYTMHDAAPSLKPRRVGFEYEGRSDSEFTYVAGTKVITNQRLSRIKTYVMAAQGEQLVREYRLGYATSALTKRSLLNTVTECDGKGVCLPATTLDYNSASGGATPFNVVMPTGTGLEDYQGRMRFDHGAFLTPADLDADGKSDMIRMERSDWAENPAGNLCEYFSRGNGTFAPWEPPGNDFTWSIDGDNIDVYPFDYNGDGRTDFIRREKGDWDDDAYMTFGVYVAKYPAGFDVYYPGTQNSWGDFYQGLLGADGGTAVITGDFNGDGRGDFIRAETKTWADNEPAIAFNVFFSTGSQGNFNPVTPTGAGYGTTLRADYVDIIPGDFNGDGKTDFIRREKSDWDDDINMSFGVYYSRGDGYFDIYYPGANAGGDIFQDQLRSDVWVMVGFMPQTAGANIIPGDFNGDGKTDFIRQQRGPWAQNNPANNFNVYFSTGKDGNFERVTPTGSEYGNNLNGDYVDIILLDYNGDGKTDFLRRERGSWDDDPWSTLGVYVSRGDGTFDVFYPGTNGSWADIFQGSCGADAGANLIPADIDGDGKSDIIRQEWGDADDDVNGSFHVFFANGDDAGDYLKKVTNGLGGTVDVTYAPLNDTTVHVKGDDAVYPNVAFNGSMYVVKSTQVGMVGSAAVDTFTYGYYNALMNMQGRGFLGFSTVWQSGPTGTSQAQYNQNFPLTGTIKQKQLQGSGYNQVVTNRTFSASTTYPGVYAVLPTLEETTHYEGTGANPPSYKSGKAYIYDAFGNPAIVRDYGVYGDASDDIDTCTVFLNNTGPWLIGYPAYSRIADSCTYSAGVCTCSGVKHTLDRYYTTAGNVSETWEMDDVYVAWISSYFTYDAHGNLLTKSTPGASQRIVETTTYDNDYKTYPVSQTIASAPLSLATTFMYDARFGALAAQTDSNGNTITNQFDGLGRLAIISGKSPAGTIVPVAKTTYGTDSIGKYRQTSQLQSWSVDSWRWERDYLDGKGRVWRTDATSTDSAKPVVVKREFDAHNQVKKQSLPFYLNDTEVYNSYSRDWLGRVSQIVDASGSVTNVSYAVNTSTCQKCVIAEVTTEAVGTANQRSSTRYLDSDGRMLRQTDADNRTTSYGYDNRGRVVSVTDAAGTSTMQYDALGRLNSTTSPDRGTITNSYFPATNWLSRTIDGNGQTIDYTYDALGRVTQKVVAGKQSITFAYDNTAYSNAIGRMTSVTVLPAGQATPSSSNTFSYTADGRVATNVIGIDGSTYTVTSSYDPQGRLTGFTYPDGATLTRTYNAQGVLAKQSVGGIDYATYNAHSASGQPTSVNYASGSTTALTYDSATRLSTAKTTRPGNVKLLDYTYSWDALHRIASVTDGRDSTRSQSFSYSAGGQLTSAVGVYGSLSYGYDSAGNMTSKEGSSYTYTNHRVTSGSGFTATYDTAGNRATQIRAGNSWVYEYDGENHLATVKKNGAVANQFAYDFTGERIKKIDANLTKTHYVTQNFEVTFLPDGRRLETKYIHDAGGRVAAITTEFAAPQALLLDLRGLDSSKALFDKTSFAGLFGYLENRALVLRAQPWAPKALFGFLSLLLAFAAVRLSRRLSPAKYTRALARLRAALLPPDTAYSRQHPLYALAIPIVLASFLAACNRVPGENLGYTEDELTAGANGEGNPVAGTYYFHNNYLASSAVVTNASGAEVARTEYKPYGEIVQTASPGLDIFRSKFTGKEWDKDSELYFYNARHYDPITGRFMSADALLFGGNENDSAALNPYAYANNNPVVYSDPSGHFIFLVVVVAVIVGAYAGGMSTNGTWNPAQWNWNSWQTYAGIGVGAFIGGVSGGLGAQFGFAGAMAGTTLEALTFNGLKFISPQGSTLQEFGIGIGIDMVTGAIFAGGSHALKKQFNEVASEAAKKARPALQEAGREGAGAAAKAVKPSLWKKVGEAAWDISKGGIKVGARIGSFEVRSMFASPFAQNQRTSASAPAARIDGSAVADYVRNMQDALLSSVGADDMMGRVSSDWGARSRSAKARGAKRAPQAYTGFATVH